MNRDRNNRPTRLTPADRARLRGPWPQERRGNALPIMARVLGALALLVAVVEVLRACAG